MKKLKLTELGRVTVDEFKTSPKVNIIVVLDNVRSAMNVGSIFRTADAMGIVGIYLCGITATPPNREITKTAIGATDAVDWMYFKTTREALLQLQDDKYEIIAIEQTDQSVDLLSYRPQKERLAIILGNEVSGVDHKIFDLVQGAIEIAQYGTKHSLNVSVCGGIVLHHLAQMLRS